MYDMNIKVRYSEVGAKGYVNLHQIIEYFQDCSTFQSEELGDGIRKNLEKDRCWYLLGWDVTIERYPMMCENVTVSTQAYKMKGFYGYRRFYISDEKGRVIVKADSIWILMNFSKKIPMRIPKEINDLYIEPGVDLTSTVKRKLSAQGNWTAIASIEITKIYLDSNEHVNNTFYVLWAEEVLPDHRKVRQMQIHYQQSLVMGDVIRIEICDEKEDQLWKVRYVNQKDEIAAVIEISLESE